jgi:hypothetical protein
MQTVTLWTLPNQQLPSIEDGRPIGPAFVTIWLIVIPAFFFLLRWASRRNGKDKSKWNDFDVIGFAALLLAVYVYFNQESL